MGNTVKSIEAQLAVVGTDLGMVVTALQGLASQANSLKSVVLNAQATGAESVTQADLDNMAGEASQLDATAKKLAAAVGDISAGLTLPPGTPDSTPGGQTGTSAAPATGGTDTPPPTGGDPQPSPLFQAAKDVVTSPAGSSATAAVQSIAAAHNGDLSNAAVDAIAVAATSPPPADEDVLQKTADLVAAIKPADSTPA